MCDIAAGVASGVAQTIVGHPLDTIKVLVQNGHPWKMKTTSMYYRGASFPFVSSILFNATVFPVYERTISITNSSYISGILSGMVVSPIMYVFDVGKIKLQTNQPLSASDFYRTKGFPITLCRESLAMTIYFSTYHWFRKQTHPLVAGGLAGLFNWTVTYPLDIIRSRQIAQNITFYEALQQGTLWRGYVPCALRAILVNASCFYVYEKTLSMCSTESKNEK
jgi:hypothetical protein